MKKLLCALLLIVLCLTAAAAEEPGVRLIIRGYRIEQITETEVRLHLLLLKEGSSAYDMNGLSVVLFDAQENELPVTDTSLLVFPMTSIPAGTHYLPVTLACTLAQPGTAADFSVRSVAGAQTPAAGATLLKSGAPWLGFMKGEELVVTAWAPLESGMRAEDCFVSLVAVDGEGRYLGNGELPAGSAQHVSGDEIVQMVCDATGWTEAQMATQGFTFGADAYAFFEEVPVPYLPALPSNFIATAYCRVQVQPGMPLVRMVDRIDMRSDGSFTIHGCFECRTDGLWQLVSIDALTLLAEDGGEVSVTDFSVDTPYCVIDEGQYLPYILTGRVEAGFAAVDFRMIYGVMSAAEADHRSVTGGGLTPSVSADGLVQLGASIPVQAGVAAEECFVCVLFLDLENDAYQGAVWTYPGEGWVQDGAIRLPLMTAPAGCTLDAALVTMYCAAE